METATIGGSQDDRERWPQEYTTMPYTQTHMQSGSQLPDKPGGGMAQGGRGWGSGSGCGGGGRERRLARTGAGPFSGIGEQKNGAKLCM